jgi:hypothetical protein
MFFYCAGMGTSTLLTPLVENIETLLTISFIFGLSSGSYSTGNFVDLKKSII